MDDLSTTIRSNHNNISSIIQSNHSYTHTELVKLTQASQDTSLSISAAVQTSTTRLEDKIAQESRSIVTTLGNASQRKLQSLEQNLLQDSQATCVTVQNTTRSVGRDIQSSSTANLAVILDAINNQAGIQQILKDVQALKNQALETATPDEAEELENAFGKLCQYAVLAWTQPGTNLSDGKARSVFENFEKIMNFMLSPQDSAKVSCQLEKLNSITLGEKRKLTCLT